MSDSNFISPKDTVLVIIDMQGSLFRVIDEHDKLLDNLLRLIQGCKVLEIPVIITEQYPRGLGPTLSEVSVLLPDCVPLPKTVFSCYRDSEFRHSLESTSRSQILLTGIETHVCVYQTSVDLSRSGYGVNIVTDCVGSRMAANKALGIQRAAAAGAKLTGMEMVLFELLQAAEGERFKAISKIVK